MVDVCLPARRLTPRRVPSAMTNPRMPAYPGRSPKLTGAPLLLVRRRSACSGSLAAPQGGELVVEVERGGPGAPGAALLHLAVVDPGDRGHVAHEGQHRGCVRGAEPGRLHARGPGVGDLGREVVDLLHDAAQLQRQAGELGVDLGL